MRSMVEILFVASLGGLGALGACSPPSSTDICHATCAEWQRCLSPQPLQTATCDAQCARNRCDADCENNSGKYDDIDTTDDLRCTNSQDVRQAEMDCLSAACGEVVSCQDGIDNVCMVPT